MLSVFLAGMWNSLGLRASWVRDIKWCSAKANTVGHKGDVSGWAEALCIGMEMCCGLAVQDLALCWLNSWTMRVGEFIHSSSCSFQMDDTLQRAIYFSRWKCCFKNQSGKYWVLLSKIWPRAMQENRRVINHFIFQGPAHPKAWLLRTNSVFGNRVTGFYQKEQYFLASGKVKAAREGDLGNVIQPVAWSLRILMCWTVK